MASPTSRDLKPRVNLPQGFNFQGRARTAPKRMGYTNGDSRNQVAFIPKVDRPLANGGEETNMGLNTEGYALSSASSWYPTCRPLKQHRKKGAGCSPPTSITTSDITTYLPRADRVSLYDLEGTRWEDDEHTYVVSGDQVIVEPEGETLLLTDGSPIQLGISPLVDWTPRSLTWENRQMWLAAPEITDFLPERGQVSQDDCRYCINSDLRIGKELKMLGKNADGVNKWVPSPSVAPKTTAFVGCPACEGGLKEIDCLVCDPTRGPVVDQRVVGPKTIKGNVISFGGNASIRSGVVINNKDTFQNYGSYLKNRGKDFKTNQVVHKIPGVAYTQCTSNVSTLPCKNSETVWPVTPQEISTPGNPAAPAIPVTSASYYKNTPTDDLDVPPAGSIYASLYGRAPTRPKNCRIGVYKPSNTQFAVQGAVSAGAYATRLKYNTITKNSASFLAGGKPTAWGADVTSNTAGITDMTASIRYSPDPVYFVKNKTNTKPPLATNFFLMPGQSGWSNYMRRTAFNMNRNSR